MVSFKVLYFSDRQRLNLNKYCNLVFMKKMIICVLLLIFNMVYSQVKGLTEDGKEVVLFENGTWKFVNESDESVMSEIALNPEIFVKNENATFLMRSKKLNIGVYFNPKQWKIASKSANPYIEYMFQEIKSEKGAVAFLQSERLEIPTYKNLKDILLFNIEKNADFYRVKTSEYRTVNGLKVLYLRYIANIKGLDFEYGAYYWLENEGYCGLVAFSAQKDFEGNFPKIKEFLNGISTAKKAETVEIKEFTNPPPPMKSK